MIARLGRTPPVEDPVLWRNVFGEPVDLDSIDRDYAQAILEHVHARDPGGFFTSPELLAKLRAVAADGRERNTRDRLRAVAYNVRCWARRLPYRAKVR